MQETTPGVPAFRGDPDPAGPRGGGATPTAAPAEESSAVDLAQRYRILAENSADVVLLLDGPDRVAWVSPSVHRMWGYDEEDLLGTVRLGLVHPADVDSIDREMQWLQTRVLSGTTIDVRIRHADGEYRWWAVRAARVEPAGGGSEFHVVLAFRDVDETVRARRDAILEHERWVAAIDAMRDPYVLLDAVRDAGGTVVDLLFADANPAACTYLGRPIQDLSGIPLREALRHPVGDALCEALAEVVTTGQPLALDGFLLAPAGARTAVDADVRAVRVGDGVSLTWRHSAYTGPPIVSD